MMRKKKSFIPALRKAAAGILLLVILLSCAACAKDGGDSTLQPTDSQGQEHPNEGDLSDYYSGADNREYFDIPAYIQKSSFVGEKVTVAMITPSEENATDFRSYVVFEDETIETEHGTFRPLQAGIYQCVYTYALEGMKYRFSYNLEVTVKDSPVFLDDPVLPAAFVEGKTYPLPAVEAYDYGHQKAAAVTVYAVCGGETVPMDASGLRIGQNHAGDTVTITWKAGDSGEAVLERKVPVIAIGSGNDIRFAELFVGSGWNEKKALDDGVHLLTTGDATATLLNPMIANSTEYRFSFGNDDQAERIVFTMTAYHDPAVSVTIGFEKGRGSSGEGKIILNGTEEKNYTYSAGNALYVRYSAVSKQFLDAEGNLLFAPERDSSGHAFNGFPGGLVVVSWRVENVYGLCDLRIEKIGAQTLNANTRDLLAPALYYNSFTGLYQLGDEIVVTGIHGVDMVDPNAEIKVSLFAGIGKNLTPVEGTFENGVFRYTPTAPGYYTIRFQSTDSSGNTATSMRQLCVYDQAKPQIQVEKDLTETAKPNDKLTLPAASATDNESVTMELFVIYPSGQMRMLQRGESITQQSFQVMEFGTYCFRIVATDASGNSTITDMYVHVSAAGGK
jgi:hypothetical protein